MASNLRKLQKFRPAKIRVRTYYLGLCFAEISETQGRMSLPLIGRTRPANTGDTSDSEHRFLFHSCVCTYIENAIENACHSKFSLDNCSMVTMYP